ncbi:NAD-dependent epimerase [Prolixibacter denitrificans]|uniref:NAD-dependent epimerase n=1 Tax=Prolixibacter denitrificans TaxID=1541063 RepID=A0A2P8CDS2_9BACT|nr:NAD-dependent epimerase [Prolixibacter denitrificans]PSK83125.1 UDP-glucuronate 4-epimerase [Prolixibacter denitrificans]GET21992.1 NAD-dependent epimerase [Prolixibacter denitrificans]
MKILVTGSAGFIGFHLVKALLKAGHEVVGLDCINDYYDVNLKYDRLAETGIAPPLRNGIGAFIQSRIYANYRFVRMKLEERESLFNLFASEKFDKVCNLAAQAGVRYSLKNPDAYINSNIIGFLNILEACRHFKVGHLVFASSSSVYGNNTQMPLSTTDHTNHPISLYAATKKSNEMMAHAYSHLFGIPATGLRFFTVYGPWGRPDMALFIFTKAILEGRPIDVYNEGKILRDFTYISDIVGGIIRIIDRQPQPTDDKEASLSGSTTAPYKIYNIGHSSPVRLMDFIESIERKLGIQAQKNLLPMQPGDVPMTWADTSELQKDFGYKPTTGIDEGISKFLEWYQTYYLKNPKAHKQYNTRSTQRFFKDRASSKIRKTSIHD